MISAIAIMSRNRVIGLNGTIPEELNIKEDKRRFRHMTYGHTVIMGRKTHDSLGKPLDGRMNVILTQNIPDKSKNITISNNGLASGIKYSKCPDECLEQFANNKHSFVIGGGEIYVLTKPFWEKIYLTVVNKEIPGDTFFPEIDYHEWKNTSVEQYEEYSFFTYERK